MVKQKICIKKDQHVYNSCYELRSRAIKKTKVPNNRHYRFAAIKKEFEVACVLCT